MSNPFSRARGLSDRMLSQILRQGHQRTLDNNAMIMALHKSAKRMRIAIWALAVGQLLLLALAGR